MEINLVNRNLQPPAVAPATAAKRITQSRGEDNEAVSHLNRQAAQTVIQVVDDETRSVQPEALPEDVLQLGEVVNHPEGRDIR
jgi:hypothetical protein